MDYLVFVVRGLRMVTRHVSSSPERSHLGSNFCIPFGRNFDYFELYVETIVRLWGTMRPTLDHIGDESRKTIHLQYNKYIIPGRKQESMVRPCLSIICNSSECVRSVCLQVACSGFLGPQSGAACAVQTHQVACQSTAPTYTRNNHLDTEQ